MMDTISLNKGGKDMKSDIPVPTDKDLLNVAIRMIEQMMCSKGEHMTRAQIFELIRKTAIKHAYNTEDNIKIIKELFN